MHAARAAILKQLLTNTKQCLNQLMHAARAAFVKRAGEDGEILTSKSAHARSACSQSKIEYFSILNPNKIV